MDPSEARTELWRRYDAGDLSAEEVEARLGLLERADGDEAAVRSALDGPIPVHRRRSTRRAVLALVLAVALAGGAGGIAALASAMSDDGDGGNDQRFVTGPAVGFGRGFAETTVVFAEPAAEPAPPEPATTSPPEEAPADDAGG